MSLRVADLPGQYLLCPDRSQIPDRWKLMQSGRWTLGVEPRLPVVDFGAGDWTGWVLGFPIDPTDLQADMIRSIEECSQRDCPKNRHWRPCWTGFSGRYVVITIGHRGNRVYLDASGSLATVYCRTQELVASTPTLVPHDPPHNTMLSEAINVAASNCFFAFGSTPKQGVARLLPNHFLNLDTFEAVRHWPHSAEKKVHDPPAAIQAITALVRGAVEAVCVNHRPYLSLTAGRDSRMLLAMCRRLRGIRYFTWSFPDGRVDIQMAKRLARQFALDHHVLRYVAPSGTDVREWLFRTGESVGELRGMRLSTTLKAMDPAAPYVPALASEVGRAFYWREGDENRIALTATDIIERMGLPEVPELVEAAERWLAGVPFRHPYDVLDLLYIEQRLGCWASVVAYAADGVFRITPFSNRTVFETMMGLPFEYRKAQKLADDIIRSAWPELLSLPFNPPGRGTRLKSIVRSALARTPILWRLSRALS